MRVLWLDALQDNRALRVLAGMMETVFLRSITCMWSVSWRTEDELSHPPHNGVCSCRVCAQASLPIVRGTNCSSIMSVSDAIVCVLVMQAGFEAAASASARRVEAVVVRSTCGRATSCRTTIAGGSNQRPLVGRCEYSNAVAVPVVCKSPMFVEGLLQLSKTLHR